MNKQNSLMINFVSILKKQYSIGTPVDVKKFVSHLGGTIEESESLPYGVSGRVIKTGTLAFKIQVRKGESPLRQNFTIAHELGHYFQYVLSKHSKDDLPLSFSEQFEHMMQKREFSIYAKIDFFHQMEALYHKFYKNQMTTAEYFNFIIKSVSAKDFMLTDLFKNYLKLYPNDSGPLLFFNYLYNEHKELFNEWKQHLTKIKDV